MNSQVAEGIGVTPVVVDADSLIMLEAKHYLKLASSDSFVNWIVGSSPALTTKLKQIIMKNLDELEKKYLELGREIRVLKIEKNSETNYPIYCLNKKHKYVVKFTDLNKGILIRELIGNGLSIEDNKWVSHTNTYAWQQLDVCPETGFYDGQLVWCWDNDDTHTRFLRFYDAKNKSTYYHYGERKGYGFYNYEPYEGNWPSWALEAFKTLER